eukprot:747167-Hanusia_phi.AAC.2
MKQADRHAYATACELDQTWVAQALKNHYKLRICSSSSLSAISSHHIALARSLLPPPIPQSGGAWRGDAGALPASLQNCGVGGGIAHIVKGSGGQIPVVAGP